MLFRYAVGAGVVAVATIGCSTTAGKPIAADPAASRSHAAGTTSETPSAATTSPALPATTPSSTVPATPTGQPVGTATMQVVGGAGPVTIRFQINGGPEQTETNVTLPWEKQYPVYNEVESSVTADSGEAELTCSIIMDGKLLAFKTQSRPTCSFAYWG